MQVQIGTVTCRHWHCGRSMNPTKINKIVYFVYCLLFVVKIKENRQLSIYHQLNTSKVSPPTTPQPPPQQQIVAKHANMSMVVSPKGVCRGNINSNMIFDFRLYQKSSDKSFELYIFRQGVGGSVVLPPLSFFLYQFFFLFVP